MSEPFVGRPVPTTKRLFQHSLAGPSLLVRRCGQRGHVQGSVPNDGEHRVTACQAQPPGRSSHRPGPEGEAGKAVTEEVTENVGTRDGPGTGLGAASPPASPGDTWTQRPSGSLSLPQGLLSLSPRKLVSSKSTFSASPWDKVFMFLAWRPHHPIPTPPLCDTPVGLR